MLFAQLAEGVVFRPAATSWRAGDLLGRVRRFSFVLVALQAASPLFFKSRRAPRPSPQATFRSARKHCDSTLVPDF